MQLQEEKKLYSKCSNCLLASMLLFLVTSCACNDPLKPETHKKTGDNNYTSGNSRSQVAELENIKSVNKIDDEITEAKAIISPLADNKINGVVTFTKISQGVRIIADIDGLTPGEHGFHIHEFGDCSGKNADSVGAHYNPNHQKHGDPDSKEFHVGDLGNLDADENGHAHYEVINKVIKLQGRNSILGRSVIIHADRDDYVTQPTGASGVKIGCGVIEPGSNS